MKPQNFSVIHPWAYDLDAVDFRYVLNNELSTEISNCFQSHEGKIFWLSYFKAQTACTVDELANALREVSKIFGNSAEFNNIMEN